MGPRTTPTPKAQEHGRKENARKKSQRLGRNAVNAVSSHDEACGLQQQWSPTQGLYKNTPIKPCVCTCVHVQVLSSLEKLPERGETNIRVEDRDHQGKFSPNRNGLFPSGGSHRGNQVTESDFGSAVSRPSVSDFPGCSMNKLIKRCCN